MKRYREWISALSESYLPNRYFNHRAAAVKSPGGVRGTVLACSTHSSNDKYFPVRAS